MPIFAPRSIHILTKSKINKQCHQVRREKDIKWLPTSGKNVCAKTVIRRSHAKFLHCSFLQEEYLPLAGVFHIFFKSKTPDFLTNSSWQLFHQDFPGTRNFSLSNAPSDCTAPHEWYDLLISQFPEFSSGL